MTRWVGLGLGIKDYRVVLASPPPGAGIPFRLAGYIVCHGEADETLTVFFVDEAGMPRSDVHLETRSGTAYRPSSHLGWHLDILRNEEPVYAFIDVANPDLNRIATGAEPVGEGESLRRAFLQAVRAGARPSGRIEQA